jgi:hypothetical protein
LRNYSGFLGMMIFLYDLALSIDHGILALQWMILYLSG